ncbi:hypothetical protein GF312_14480 [Candidatus Poribacteria bacterium]|nr:hypothetical protein [Candidatus Poribacteria bacterium]
MDNQKSPEEINNSRVSWRSIIIGSILIPFNCFWILQFEFHRWSFPTYLVPYYNVIFCLVLLMGTSFVLKKIASKWAFRSGELLVAYLMMCIASSICSHNMMQILVTSMGHAYWFATPENEWADMILPHLPEWLTVSDQDTLRAYYEGETTFYRWDYIRPWIVPFLWWLAFTVVLLWVMLCINVVIRRQWMERERLTYPIIQLPLAIIDKKNNLLKSKAMWIGFSITAGMTLINGVNSIFPFIPYIPLKRLIDLRQYITERPWNAIGWTPITLHPHLIGLGFLMPLDLLFSSWFFYWVLKAQYIFRSAFSFRMFPGYPYAKEQSFGAYMAIILAVLWTGRRHLKNVLASVFNKKTAQKDPEGGMSYRTACLGIILGIVFLCVFSVQGGMSVYIAIVFFVIYYLLSTAMTRMRAELGFPIHDAHYPLGPDHVTIISFGTRRLGPGNLSMLALYHWFNRTYASHPMPHQLEGFKMADELRVSGRRFNRHLIIILTLATAISVISTFWLILESFYRNGSSSGHYTWWGSGGFGRETYYWLESWLSYPSDSNIPAVGFIGVGFFSSLVMMALRFRFLWWPFHPLGYAISSSWGVHVWSSFLISWIIKVVVLRYGGLKTYRKAVPLFLGLILGEYLVGSLWNWVSIIWNIPTYQFSVG